MKVAALHFFAVVLVYAGLIGMAAGALSVLKPLRFLGIRSRGLGAVVFALAWAIAAVGMLLPAPLARVEHARTDLDRAMPAWQFRERHWTRIHASPERVYQSIRAVTVGEIALLRTLTWIRSPHLGAAPASILNPPVAESFFDVALRSGFIIVSDTPPREVVVGTVVAGRVRDLHGEPTAANFITLAAPGFVKATMNFRVEPAGGGECDLITETRVFATDPKSARLFAGYWRVIYPGSALIRIMWLRAIRHRSER